MTDPWVISALVLSGLIACVYSLPLLNPVQLEFFAESVTMLSWLLLTVLAATAGLSQCTNREERRFWRRIAIACSFWIVSEIIMAAGIIDSGESVGAIVLDCLYFCYYLWWVFALEACPHIDRARRAGERVRRFAWSGRFLFATGLFAYFILLPRFIQIDVYTAWVPSFLCYLALDLYLAARLAAAAFEAESRRWRVMYILLTCAMLFIATTDTLEGLYLAGRINLGSVVPSDALWYAPFFFIIIAARVRQLPMTSSAKETERRQPATPKGVPLLAYSFAFPVIHFVLRLFGSSPPELETSREVFILVWLFLLGGLNLGQYFHLEARGREHQKRRRLAEERALYLSKRDALTGLLNRRELETILNEAITSSDRHEHGLAVLFVDLDGFKKVNDSFGHSKGDTVLQTVAEKIRFCVRDTDSAIRFGGDEFVLVLEHFENRSTAASVAQRVLSTLAQDIHLDGQPIELSASIGISFYPENGETPQELIDSADATMYRAKAEGGTRYRFAGA